ncbi:MAG: methyltransferase domain-containing protein, partial [Nitrospiria bacterium]
TNACNLSCSHCLVNSSPSGEKGGGTDFWLRVIEQGLALGVSRFFVTGGEPFLRDDIFELIDRILAGTSGKTPELVILTNGMLFRGEHLKRLTTYDPKQIQFQISLDGPTAEINNPIRGNGTFDATIHGIKEVISLGFLPTLTTVVNRANVDHLPGMVKLASSLGVKNLHLLLSHHRGRAVGTANLESPPVPALLEAFKITKRLCREAGITFDNFDTLLGQLMGPSGVKTDLSNAAYESLCVYADGQVYPSAALAGIPELKMGNPDEQPLEAIWRKAALAKSLRTATVQKKTKCKDCYLKYLCGGGDIEHSYLYSGQFLGEDPFSEFYEQWMLETLFDFAEGKVQQRTASGYDRPVIFSAMGDGAVLEDVESGAPSTGGFEVALSRSVCVLSVDLDHSRRVVSDFYGGAADTPQPALCCPEAYPLADADHIPQEVLDISYGCGSPVGLAGLTQGETMVDLGSGGGIDCFIAAKKVGPSGRVVGIDMTDQMLREAHAAKTKVVANLGFDNVAFKKGYLEEVPLPDQFADLVTSNCVINLSPDKKQVFVEIWRILKDFGRVVVSDTISEKPVPKGMRANPRLWGECVSGALTEAEYLSKMEQAGFYGLSILKRTLWREVEGYKFFSVVVQGYKFEKKSGCRYIGQYATYLGPMQAVVDEEGHLFPRDHAVEVCTDTAAKLQKPPYQSVFSVTDGTGVTNRNASETEEACATDGGCC